MKHKSYGQISHDRYFNDPVSSPWMENNYKSDWEAAAGAVIGEWEKRKWEKLKAQALKVQARIDRDEKRTKKKDKR